MIIGKGFTQRFLSADEMREIVAESVDSAAFAEKRVLVIIPDGTRTMPMPLMFRIFREVLRPRVKALDYLVALGTHPIMSDGQLSKLIGQAVVDGQAGESHIFNHHWEDPAAFVQLGTIPAADISELSNGLMAVEVPVSLNKLILDYDHILICGPVFPHEVVGFSGGNKYFFPGIGGADIINFTHWLGATITNYEVIGSGYTPVRAVIDRAAALIPRPVSCLSLVVTKEGTARSVLWYRSRSLDGGFRAFIAKAYRVVRQALSEGAFCAAKFHDMGMCLYLVQLRVEGWAARKHPLKGLV